MWQLKVVEHGTGRTISVPSFGATKWSRRLDDLTQATTSWAATDTPRIRKWEWELEVWGWGRLVWAGPIVTPTYETAKPVTISARDLGQRFERLFIARDRTYTAQDLGLIFGQITNDALEGYPELNITVVSYATGTLGDREYRAALYERLADKQRELARTDVDYTFVGRQLVIGGSSIPGARRWKLHDGMASYVRSVDDGLSDVNDAVVVGSKPTQTTIDDKGIERTTVVGNTPVGRYQDDPSIARVGPLQVRFSEPDILDESSAGVAARNRIRYFNGRQPDLTVVLKEGQYDPDDLVCGSTASVAFSDALVPYGQEGDYLLQGVDGDISASGQAQVVLSLIQA